MKIPILLLVFLSYFPEKCISKRRRSATVTTGPCSFPLPTFKNFSAFCQIPYHKVPYVCDPGGILSRTEVEFLHETAIKLNMTSCFCNSRYSPVTCQAGIRIAVVLLPFVSWSSIRDCDPTYSSSSISTTTILYSQLLAAHWQDHCELDVIFLYIKNWQTEMLRTPLLIPLFGDQWPHLRRFSIPIVTSIRETTLISLQNAMSHASRLIHVDSTPAHAAIPRWALAFGGIMLSVVVAAIYIANCITEKMGQRNQKSLIPKRSDKFRAGFGGGVMMNGSGGAAGGAQSKKSVMMFRTFSKSTNKQINNNRL